MAEPIILYGTLSPNVLKVGIMLEELGLEYQLRFVSVFGGEQFSADFTAKSPLSKLPVLYDPALGAPLFESGAIIMYLAETYQRFLPVSGLARYEVLEWIMVQMGSIGPMFGQVNHFAYISAETEHYARARYRTQAGKLYRVLDERLSGRDYIAGDAYSIADMLIWPWAIYLEKHGFAREDHPALARWTDMVGDRPAVKAADAKAIDAFREKSRTARKGASDAEIDRFFGREPHSPGADFTSIRMV